MSEDEDKRHCSVCKIPHFERNNYYYGKLMTVRDFYDEQCYFNEKRWLINRMVHGWGVVCGLEVIEDTGRKNGDKPKVIIKPGLAIDCCGREILVCHKKDVTLDPKKSTCLETVQDETKLVVCLEYRECKTERVNVSGKICDLNDQYEYNRTRDSFEAVVRYSEEVNIKDPHKKLCPLIESKGKDEYIYLHKYICKNLKTEFFECPECPCLVLAEITINGSKITKIDQCSKRKIVYNNPLLFDLVNCYHGDLPHIMKISWNKLHGKKDVDWSEFVNIIQKNGLTITFDKQIQYPTINRRTFLISAFTLNDETGHIDIRYIPLKFNKEDIQINDEMVTQVTLKCGPKWNINAILGTSAMKLHGADIEITVRGSSVLDTEEKALDGDFIRGTLPSGNGTQGGDFLSWFHVKPKLRHSTSEDKMYNETEE
jgi:hypothetical protein